MLSTTANSTVNAINFFFLHFDSKINTHALPIRASPPVAPAALGMGIYIGHCLQRTLPTNNSLAWPQSCGAPYMWRGTGSEASYSVSLEATVASSFGLLTVSSSSCLQLPPPTTHSRCNRLHKIITNFMPLNPIAVLLGPRVDTSHP